MRTGPRFDFLLALLLLDGGLEGRVFYWPYGDAFPHSPHFMSLSHKHSLSACMSCIQMYNFVTI